MEKQLSFQKNFVFVLIYLPVYTLQQLVIKH